VALVVKEWASGCLRLPLSLNPDHAAVFPWPHTDDHHLAHAALGRHPPVSRLKDLPGHNNMPGPVDESLAPPARRLTAACLGRRSISRCLAGTPVWRHVASLPRASMLGRAEDVVQGRPLRLRQGSAVSALRRLAFWTRNA
jgi:hypothetical protein